MVAPLEGVKVLDLTRLLPGPVCTMWLGDLGAEVIKIEEPKRGDYCRWREPKIGGEWAGFLMVNRNKKSLTLNLKAPEGKDIFLKLAQGADCLIEGFRPGVMERMGLGYEALSQINPSLIYCSLSGYGQGGPYKEHVGHDINYIGFGGILGLTGQKDGEPLVPGVPMADLGGGGMVALVSILAALLARQKTGKGQYLDVAMLDGVVSWLGYLAGPFFATGEVPRRGKMRLNGLLACYGVYKTKDGKYITLGALEEQFWANLCKAIERPDLLPHQYATEEKKKEVTEALQEVFLTKNRDEWVSLLQDKDICIGPVYELDEVFQDPQVLHRQMLFAIEHPDYGKLKQVACPFKVEDASKQVTAPPHIGQHTLEVLQELGYAREEVERLREKGVV